MWRCKTSFSVYSFPMLSADCSDPLPPSPEPVPVDMAQILALLGVDRYSKEDVQAVEQGLADVLLDLPNQEVLHRDCARATCLTGRALTEEGNVKVLALERVLTYYCREHGCEYRQGLHDLAAPLVLCLDTLPQAYLALRELLRRLMPSVPMGRELVVYQQLCEVTGVLVTFLDPELASVIEGAGLSPDMYALDWFTTLYGSMFKCGDHTFGGVQGPGGRAASSACLYVWLSWLRDHAGAAPLCVVFFGLAWLLQHSDDIKLCGPVPELPEYLKRTVCSMDPTAVDLDFLLRKMGELLTSTPRSYLRHVQRVLACLSSEGGGVCLTVEADDAVAFSEGLSTQQLCVLVDIRPIHISRAAPVKGSIRFDLAVVQPEDVGVFIERARVTQERQGGGVVILVLNEEGELRPLVQQFLRSLISGGVRGVTWLKGGYAALQGLAQGEDAPSLLDKLRQFEQWAGQTLTDTMVATAPLVAQPVYEETPVKVFERAPHPPLDGEALLWDSPPPRHVSR